MSSRSGVDRVLQMCASHVRETVEALRRVVREAAPEASERGYTGWRNLVYYYQGMFCYIAPLKDSVNLGFHRGVDLPDPDGLLQGTGKKLRHVKVGDRSDIADDALRTLVREAYKLNGG